MIWPVGLWTILLTEPYAPRPISPRSLRSSAVKSQCCSGEIFSFPDDSMLCVRRRSLEDGQRTGWDRIGRGERAQRGTGSTDGCGYDRYIKYERQASSSLALSYQWILNIHTINNNEHTWAAALEWLFKHSLKILSSLILFWRRLELYNSYNESSWFPHIWEVIQHVISKRRESHHQPLLTCEGSGRRGPWGAAAVWRPVSLEGWRSSASELYVYLAGQRDADPDSHHTPR